MKAKLANKIIGREREQTVLSQLLKSKRSEFLALYGRRRVGKTYLIRNFFEKIPAVFFHTTGIQKGKLKEQLEQFAKQIGVAFYGSAAIKTRSKWLDAFEDLTQATQRVPRNKKVVLFLDEFPWMATKKSGLLQALDYYWNRYWAHDSRLKLIICGSSASWIIEKIINNKGGLYNRVTQTLQLHPFTLGETKAFLNSMGIQLNQRHILDLYMVLGGIPHYLALIRRGLTAHQCIDELCFQKDGQLVKEFERLFASLFQESEIYVELARVIARHRYGIGQAQLMKEKRVSEGGRTVHRLKELEEAGFIVNFVPHGHQEKGVYYKIIDEYILFYLHWIEPSLKSIRKQDRSTKYWLAKTQSSSWKSWAGYAFEAVCYKHLAQIRQALAIDPGAEVGTWRYSPRAKANHSGTQIDLLFDRTDGAVTICEIKYSEQPYVIDKAYAHNLMNKVTIYGKQTKTQKQLFLAMITANSLKPSMYSEEIITKQVGLDDLFKMESIN